MVDRSCINAIKGIIADTVHDHELATHCIGQIEDVIRFNMDYTHIEIIYYILASNDLPRPTRNRLRKYANISSVVRSGDNKPVPVGAIRNALLLACTDDAAVEALSDGLASDTLNQIPDTIYGKICRKILSKYGIVQYLSDRALKLATTYMIDELNSSSYLKKHTEE